MDLARIDGSNVLLKNPNHVVPFLQHSNVDISPPIPAQIMRVLKPVLGCRIGVSLVLAVEARLSGSNSCLLPVALIMPVYGAIWYSQNRNNNLKIQHLCFSILMLIRMEETIKG
jgi:hypothetical protein